MKTENYHGNFVVGKYTPLRVLRLNKSQKNCSGHLQIVFISLDARYEKSVFNPNSNRL